MKEFKADQVDNEYLKEHGSGIFTDEGHGLKQQTYGFFSGEQSREIKTTQEGHSSRRR